MLKNPLLQKRLLAYSAAAGLALAGGVALADTNEINSVNPVDVNPDFILTNSGGEEISLDFDRDLQNDIKLEIVGGVFKMHPLNEGAISFTGFYSETAGDKVFEEAENIPKPGVISTSVSSTSVGSFAFNSIKNVENGSIGIKLKIGSNTHYGWIRFDSTNTTMTIEGYAYETEADTPIQTPSGEALAVTLANFAAIADGTDVSVTWSTVSESDNLGFNLYRSSDPADLGTQLNAELIPAQAPGSGQGSTYDYLDANLAAGSYFYTLEDVDVNGTPTRHAPVSVTIGQVTAVALNQLESSDEGSPLGLLVAGGALAAVAVAARRRRSSND